MSDIYSLHLYDTELVRFSLEKRGLEGLVAEVLSVQRDKSHLMPPDLELTGTGVVRWLERRVIPKNRAFVDEILKTLGLGRNDTKGIMDVCKRLSLNGSYWVVPDGFEGTLAGRSPPPHPSLTTGNPFCSSPGGMTWRTWQA